MNSEYYLPAPTAGPQSVTPESAGWECSGLTVLTVEAGATHAVSTAVDEYVVVPLAGSATVTVSGVDYELSGRSSVFDGPSDFVYVGRDNAFALTSAAGGRFALGTARAEQQFPTRYVAASDVSVELRGAGNCSRQVHNFATADRFEADSIIACEVITPGGNWSSYPAHKHDENSESESQLEEIYYFEIDSGANGSAGFGYHRVYGTDERPIEVLEEVRSGDVVLVPHGYHGPSIAAPGYHMYYLNIMAGPGPGRSWKICDDPSHTWLRGTWQDQDIDSRLPIGNTQRRQ